MLAIGVVACMVAAGAAWTWFNGPNSPLAQAWKKRLAELEVSTRMGSPEEIIDALRETAKIYRKMRKNWEAETVLRRALHMSKQHFGEINQANISILEDYADLMDSLRRNKDAQSMRNEIQKIRQRKN